MPATRSHSQAIFIDARSWSMLTLGTIDLLQLTFVSVAITLIKIDTAANWRGCINSITQKFGIFLGFE